MAVYEYNLISDFSNGINSICLHKSIESFGFTNRFNGITIEYETSDIYIDFTGSLDTEDLSNLDTIIANHNPDNCDEESDVGNVIGVAGDVESLTQSSTNSSLPQRKLRMSIIEVPAGRYRIGWYYEWAQSSQSTDFRARVQLNDIIDLMYHSEESKEAGTDQSIPICGYVYQDLTEGSHNIDLDYWAENNTSYIKNARLEIWRSA